MKVSESFLSLQGEGLYAGVPMVFIRLQGCNLYPDRVCRWCDTRYAQGSDAESITLEEVINKVQSYKELRWVCITGGEPLLQVNEVGRLVQSLRTLGYSVEIETNGTLPRPNWYKHCFWSVDYKCPSSGVKSFNPLWLDLGGTDQIKFVVADKEDLRFVGEKLASFKPPLAPLVIVSPMIPVEGPDWMTGGEVAMLSRRWLQRVWNFCVDNNLRFSLQLHKIVWGNKKGV